MHYQGGVSGVFASRVNLEVKISCRNALGPIGKCPLSGV